MVLLGSFVSDLNAMLQQEPALHEVDFDGAGFEWIDCHNAADSVLSYVRKGPTPKDFVIVACNFTPVPREGYRIGVPKTRQLKEIFNSDESRYGGSGMRNGTAKISKTPWHGFERSIEVNLPPLSVVIFR